MFSLNCRGTLLTAEHPLIMGIVNLTPDSFYKGSRQQHESIIPVVKKMLDDGADIIDIGGQSTRPGAERISAGEEAERVMPAIEQIRKNFPAAIISIDTFYAEVAHNAVNVGASIINDISAGSIDREIIPLAAQLHTPYICMHMKGMPADMQQKPHYENVVKEVLDFFIAKTEECRMAGVNDVMIDPGFGFGKTVEHNLTLLKNLHLFSITGKPVLVGLSRKATIYKTLGTSAEEALNGTTVLNTLALQNGASILRVHDVREAREAVVLWGKYGSS